MKCDNKFLILLINWNKKMDPQIIREIEKITPTWVLRGKLNGRILQKFNKAKQEIIAKTKIKIDLLIPIGFNLHVNL